MRGGGPVSYFSRADCSIDLLTDDLGSLAPKPSSFYKRDLIARADRKTCARLTCSRARLPLRRRGVRRCEQGRREAGAAFSPTLDLASPSRARWASSPSRPPPPLSSRPSINKLASSGRRRSRRPLAGPRDDSPCGRTSHAPPTRPSSRPSAAIVLAGNDAEPTSDAAADAAAATDGQRVRALALFRPSRLTSKNHRPACLVLALLSNPPPDIATSGCRPALAFSRTSCLPP